MAHSVLIVADLRATGGDGEDYIDGEGAGDTIHGDGDNDTVEGGAGDVKLDVQAVQAGLGPLRPGRFIARLGRAGHTRIVAGPAGGGVDMGSEFQVPGGVCVAGGRRCSSPADGGAAR